MYYHGARYYSAWLGRWTSTDPAGMVDGANLYRYALNNPVKMVDPSGTQSWRTPYPAPFPVSGQTPFNFVSESPALANWERAVQNVLEPQFQGGSLPQNLARFESHVTGLPQGARRTAGTAQHYAGQFFTRVVSRFYQLEAATPSFEYTPKELNRLEEGRAPRSNVQLHHETEIFRDPTRALRAGNITFTEGGSTGGLQRGTSHYEAHYGPGAQRREAFLKKLYSGVGTAPPERASGRVGNAAVLLLQIFQDPQLRQQFGLALSREQKKELRAIEETQKQIAAAYIHDRVIEALARREGKSFEQKQKEVYETRFTGPREPTIGPPTGRSISYRELGVEEPSPWLIRSLYNNDFPRLRMQK